MKKNFKLVLALVLALSLFASMSVAFAGTLTIKNEMAGFTYEVYQIFTGDQSSGKLSNVKWGTAIPAAKRAEFLAELKTENVISNAITYDDADANASAVALVEALSSITNDSDVAKKLADITAKYATVKTGEALSTQTTVSGKQAYQFTGLVDGYYLVKNTAKADGTDDQKKTTYSEFIIQVVGEAVAEAKNSTVTVDKKIDADTAGYAITDSDKDKNSVAIGDTIPYIIVGTLPTNYDQYDNYYYKFSDEMQGIDYVNADITTTTATEGPAKVYLVDKDGSLKQELSGASITFTNQTAADNKTTLTIEFDNLKKVTLNEGVTILGTDKIVVKYWGQLNNFAKVGNQANPNDVDLTFTNNPEKSGDGNSHEYKTVTGTTPKAHTDTYDTGVKLYKTGDGTKLAGAKFQLTGTNLFTVRQKNGYKFVETPYTLSTLPNVSEAFEKDGETNVVYYALKDNAAPTDPLKYTYTTTPKSDDMDAATKDRYVAGKTYNKVTYTTTVTEKADDVVYTGYTDDDGYLYFEGLKPGTYTLKELVAPAGFNLASDVEFTITFAPTDDKKFTVTGGGGAVVDTDGEIKISIDDKGGNTLPSTGGIGTTIFYIGGSILVLAAAILLITKRRMSAND